MLPLGHPVPQFDVLFPEKHLKIVAVRARFLSRNSPNSVWRQCTSPGTAGEAKAFSKTNIRKKGVLPKPISAKRGCF